MSDGQSHSINQLVGSWLGQHLFVVLTSDSVCWANWTKIFSFFLSCIPEGTSENEARGVKSKNEWILLINEWHLVKTCLERWHCDACWPILLPTRSRPHFLCLLACLLFEHSANQSRTPALDSARLKFTAQSHSSLPHYQTADNRANCWWRW